MEKIVEIAWLVVGAYVAIGVLFSLAFVVAGAKKIDPAADGGSWGFKVLVFPGCVAFWPLLAKRWFGGASEPPGECSPHRKAAGGCAGCSRGGEA